MLETSQSQSHGVQEGLHPAPQEVRTIICPICEGIYAPSSVHSSFLLASDNALEAAFMSLCHFCFRCRRPACPQCWDEVHGVCGDCVREAHLAFRTEVAPLDGMRFPPPRGETTNRGEVTASLLSCVKPGRFVQDALSATVSKSEAARIAGGKISAQVSEAPQERRERQIGYAGHGAAERKPQPITDRVAVAKRPVRANDDEEDEDEQEQETSRGRRAFQIIERVLTVLILVLLVSIIVLIALALYSNAVNALVIQLLHVDIRAEVAYLVHLVQQIHG